jgi:pimeloyl-ACP methyl ester carboxylesterase
VRRITASVAATVVGLLTAATGPFQAGADEPGGVENVPVAFEVSTSNTSGVPCPSGSATFKVAGHLVAPAGTLDASGPRAVTLYLHGLDGGEWFWNFQAVPGYDHAGEMARLGHTSVVIDRIGYGGAQPPGTASCVGSQADVAHQIIGKLRSGAYTAQGRDPVGFDKIVLAGHSIGGAIAQIEAYSYQDVDALAVLLWADNASTRDAQAKFFDAGRVCLGGGQEARAGGPGGYAYFAPNPGSFKADLFHDADPAVLDAAAPLQNRNPCGDIASVLQTLFVDQFRVGEISVPVLLVYGDKDKVFSAPEATGGLSAQRNLYRGTNDVTEVLLKDTGHFMTLEQSAPRFRASLSTWLCDHQLTGPGACANPVSQPAAGQATSAAGAANWAW